MKRFLILLSLLCGLAGMAVAQSAREDIDTHPHIAIASHSVYAAPYYYKPIAEAPKGYKPFYISHYGRHGSRYEASQNNIDKVAVVFRRADSLGILTAKGREVLLFLEEFDRYHQGYIGEITSVGMEQHKGIARRMYHRFKGVFSHGSIVDSRASTYSRCIMSMAAFNESLKECQPMLETKMETGGRHQLVIRPISPDNPLMPKGVTLRNISHGQEHRERLIEWSKKQDVSHSLGMLFTSTEQLNCNMRDFILALETYTRLAFIQNFGKGDRTLIDSIFTPDERYAFYGYGNYLWYNAHVSSATPFARKIISCTRPLVEDIINYADLAIEGKNSAVANLRFGHDYYLLSLLGAISFNEYSSNIDVQDIDRFNNEWRGHKAITMASNLQMVLYRSKRGGDILVRFLYNENDVTLPIDSDIAPFYKWSDVKSYLLGRLNSFSK